MKLGDDRAVLGLETAALCRLETVVRDVERGELLDGGADARKAVFELRRTRRQRCALLRRSHDVPRVVEERRSLRLGTGDTPCGDQGICLPMVEAMSLACSGEGELIHWRQRTQGVGERQPELVSLHLHLKLGRQSRDEGVSPRNPAQTPPEQPGDRLGRQAVLTDERVDDARLVHRGEGPGRRVRAQHQTLELDRTRRRLDDDRYIGASLLLPASQALEAIDDFVGVVRARDHAQRHRCEVLGRLGRRAAQHGKRRAQRADRDREHRVSGRHDSDRYPRTRARLEPR